LANGTAVRLEARRRKGRALQGGLRSFAALAAAMVRFVAVHTVCGFCGKDRRPSCLVVVLGRQDWAESRPTLVAREQPESAGDRAFGVE
jgi:hypothetical protein